jgi:hypothetical protein
MKFIFLAASLAIGQTLPIPELPIPSAPDGWNGYQTVDPLDLLKDMERYEPAKLTQRVFNRTIIEAVPRAGMRHKWLVPGGLEDVDPTAWRSEFYKNAWVSTYRAGIDVFNGSNTQRETSIQQTFEPGARFADKLINTSTGKVFEVRLSEKQSDGTWEFTRIFSDWDQAPKGYVKVRQRSCVSCHSLAGSAHTPEQDWYGVAIPPGGDNVFSLPMYGLER